MASHPSLNSLASVCLGTALCAAPALYAQSSPATSSAPTMASSAAASLQSCSAIASDSERLACFDAAAAQSKPASNGQGQANAAWYSATPADAQPSSTALNSPAGASGDSLNTGLRQEASVPVDNSEGCRNSAYDTTSKFWELTSETDCGNLRFRGYRPMIFAFATSNRINRQPYSPAPDNGLATYQDYQRPETRIQLSIRTKLASNLLTSGSSTKRDSLWFGFTSNSYWQTFNSGLSRPFRNTDYQPEFMYVYPLEWQLPGNAKLRYAGLGINHQSNGQSNPLSRSWNRYYMMLGMDVGSSVRLQTRLWHRISETAAKDDNPNISDYIGRGEFMAAWDVNKTNTMVMTLRHSLRSSAKGSSQLEWYHTLGESFAGGKSNLRLYTSLFSGYGDSLIDYNFRRTVFSVGVSLLDF